MTGSDAASAPAHSEEKPHARLVLQRLPADIILGGFWQVGVMTIPASLMLWLIIAAGCTYSWQKMTGQTIDQIRPVMLPLSVLLAIALVVFLVWRWVRQVLCSHIELSQDSLFVRGGGRFMTRMHAIPLKEIRQLQLGISPNILDKTLGALPSATAGMPSDLKQAQFIVHRTNGRRIVFPLMNKCFAEHELGKLETALVKLGVEVQRG